MPSINLVFRIVIGGFGDISATLAQTVETIAAAAGEVGVDGFTVTPGIGSHVSWGAEPVVVIETCAPTVAVERLVSILCTLGAQTCAYVTVNGATAALWYPDGRKECI